MSYNTIEDVQAAQFLISPPGDTLLETLNALKMSQADLALRMNRPVKTINEIVKGKAAIIPETAIQLERVLKIPASFWLNREANYRRELAEIAEAEKLIQQQDWLINFPLAAMKKLNWIQFENSVVSKMESILSFLSISGTEGFEQIYEPKFQLADFREDAHGKSNKYAVAAWLRKGEIQASELKTGEYSVTAFKENLKKAKSLAAIQPDDFFSQLQILCSEAGVKVVHTPCLPGATLHGSTHWEKDTPVIQLSNRYKRNDIFWFTFFHEAGHILKHGKKATFIEGLQYNEEARIKEQEADETAIEYTLNKEQEKEIRSQLPLSGPGEINKLAKKYNTHPACIMGRFARSNAQMNQLGWKLGFFKKIELE
ncbi:MAG TPA: ImmA/IrrE family metallo-endopeptidase [Bacteroidales bacterium]|nr:ImmA/IrrE family metallo-endopeptidase [Bacteroidales bacterium]